MTGRTLVVLIILLPLSVLWACDHSSPPSTSSEKKEKKGDVESAETKNEDGTDVFDQIRNRGDRLVQTFLGHVRNGRLQKAYKQLDAPVRKKWSRNSFDQLLKNLRRRISGEKKLRSTGSGAYRTKTGLTYSNTLSILGGGSVQIKARQRNGTLRITHVTLRVKHTEKTDVVRTGTKQTRKLLKHLQNQNYEKAKQILGAPDGSSQITRFLKKLREGLKMSSKTDISEYLRPVVQQITNGNNQIIFVISPPSDAASHVLLRYQAEDNTLSIEQMKLRTPK